MKTGGGKGHYFKPLVEKMEAAGFVLICRANNNHLKFKAPDRPVVIVPCKLEDRRVAHRIARIAGIAL